MFQSWSSFYSFRHKKEHEERYFHSKEVQEFLDGVIATARERVESIPKGQRYWRAQLGSHDEPCCDFDGQLVDYRTVPYSAKRMKPLPKKASEGRVNPKGIPYLYLSTDEKTAISEVRPCVGSYVTVVQFETQKDLKVIDCSCGEINPMDITASDLDKLFHLKPPGPEEVTKTVWRCIDLAFSEAVDRSDTTPDYIPTQIIAELFKRNGFDGIKYMSLFNSGKNLALYDIDSAKQKDDDGKVIQIKKDGVIFQADSSVYIQQIKP